MKTLSKGREREKGRKKGRGEEGKEGRENGEEGRNQTMVVPIASGRNMVHYDKYTVAVLKPRCTI